MGPQIELFGIKIGKVASQKASKNRCRKSIENYAKSSQNDAKMDAKINVFFMLFRKRRKRSRPFVFPYILMFWACKIDAKSMTNPCKIDAGKRHAKSMENDAKMEPKWEPKSSQNQKSYGKKACRK